MSLKRSWLNALSAIAGFNYIFPVKEKQKMTLCREQASVKRLRASFEDFLGLGELSWLGDQVGIGSQVSLQQRGNFRLVTHQVSGRRLKHIRQLHKWPLPMRHCTRVSVSRCFAHQIAGFCPRWCHLWCNWTVIEGARKSLDRKSNFKRTSFRGGRNVRIPLQSARWPMRSVWPGSPRCPNRPKIFIENRIVAIKYK